jgi:hypothetical protein
MAKKTHEANKMGNQDQVVEMDKELTDRTEAARCWFSRQWFMNREQGIRETAERFNLDPKELGVST